MAGFRSAIDPTDARDSGIAENKFVEFLHRHLAFSRTSNDRVHPGHARKMAALTESQGHDFLYYENMEGGHGGAADNKQSAFMRALAYTFLWRELE